jgi:Outer membrane protein beta-barrel domain
MSGRRVWIAVLSVMTMLVVPAAAQYEKNELAGLFGRTIISDQGITGATYFDPLIRSGKGTSFEIDYAHRFLTTPVFAISGELPLMFNLDEDLNAGEGVVPIDYKQYFITPAVRANLFPTTAVSPWISFGGGFAHFSENKNLIYDAGANPGQSKTSAAIQGGIGLDVRIWHEISLRGEARDFWSGEPDFPLAPTGKTRQHNYFVGVGVVWHF